MPTCHFYTFHLLSRSVKNRGVYTHRVAKRERESGRAKSRGDDVRVGTDVGGGRSLLHHSSDLFSCERSLHWAGQLNASCSLTSPTWCCNLSQKTPFTVKKMTLQFAKYRRNCEKQQKPLLALQKIKEGDTLFTRNKLVPDIRVQKKSG